MTAVAPYGAWRSPISAEHLVEHAVGLYDLSYDNGALYWVESRPSEGGRRVIVRLSNDEAPVELFGEPYSAQSYVHEYGGRCYSCIGDICYFTNRSDQAIYRVAAGAVPTRLTKPGAPGETVSFADFVIDRDGSRLFAVRERHGIDAKNGVAGTVNDLVTIDCRTGAVEVLSQGHDFYSSPRLSPDATRLVFVAWDHPNMPWDATTLYGLDLTRASAIETIETIEKGEGYSISQPRFDPSGNLFYLSDRSGYVSIYREHFGLVADVGYDLGAPDWGFGQSSYLPGASDMLAVRGGERLGRVHDGQFEDLKGPFAVVSSLARAGDKVAAIVASPTRPAAIARFDPGGGAIEWLRDSRTVPVDGAYLSLPEEVTVSPGTGSEVHAWYYPPTNPDFVPEPGEAPPLIVECHGGPTGKALPSFNLQLQYATSRGYGVVQVNYGGSSGYGRAYRERLDNSWGVVDVEDCCAVAEHLVATKRADKKRLLIRGGSAGGFTALRALCTSELFAAGASYYGVADLLLLAKDTHKFEAHYLDRLIGPLPEQKARYLERSPLHHADKITVPVIFFQGLEDKVVPPNQTEAMVAALRARGVPVDYVTFEGERHGFQRAETIIEVARAELAFYAKVLQLEQRDDDDGAR